MTAPAWLADEARLTAAITFASLLASGLRLIIMKAFLEPAAVFIGRTIYRRANHLAGNQMPNWPQASKAAVGESDSTLIQ